MARNVFIFGAGASREAGGPLIRDFFDMAREHGDRDSYDRVREGLKALRATYPVAQLDLLNVENLATAFEMATYLEHPGLAPTLRQVLPDALKKLIVTTVGNEMLAKCPKVTYVGWQPPETYMEFVRSVLFDLRSFALISFNYDVGLDLALAMNPVPEHHAPPSGAPDQRLHLDYSLGPASTDTPPVFESGLNLLLKPHGSFNWGRCGECGLILVWQPLDYAKLDFQPGRFVTVGEHVIGLEHCGKPAEVLPLITPPLWGKGLPTTNLASVWRRVAVELSDAVNVFVVGYSLSEADHFFRYLFGLGCIGADLQRVWVIDPAPSGTEERFRRFLGPEAAPYLRVHAKEFGEAIALIRVELRQAEEYW